jgi:excisionase family DNA binding protein
MPKEKLLSPSEAAGLLGISPVTLSKWARKGAIQAHQTLGRHRRFTYTEIQRFAREQGMTLFDADDSPTRVLVVEDDPQLSTFLLEALTEDAVGVLAERAGDGFEAGRLIQKFRPQIVLLDIMLPGVDGFEVCRQLQADPETREIRVIAMTGYYSKENAQRILQSGAEACLQKPFSRAQLFDALGLQGRSDGSQAQRAVTGRLHD